ncbi:MAG: RagB/SusD family nutrient uptake outer membrane protein, partial [Pedobacter sp.]
MEFANWEALPYPDLQRIYTWEKDNLFAQDGRINEWNANYTAVYYCNSVLSGLEKIARNPENHLSWDNIKGQALFFRGQFLLRTVILWANAYDEGTAKQDLGIPLRLNENFNEPTTRASLEASYQQILLDLSLSATLLPVKASHPIHPSKPAAYGLLARTNLAMRNYGQAGRYADSCLNLYSKLMDFNQIDVAANFPFQQFNEEVILWNRILAPRLINQSNAKVNPDLYNSYHDDDLRKKAYFNTNADGSHSFKGYYEQLAAPFGGVATDEIVLIKAECLARTGNTSSAMLALNTLMAKRISHDKFENYTATSANEALTLILNERRKELLWRDLRWMDIKRLNKEGANIILTRKLGDRTFQLQPNDLKYALPIPEDVIRLSGITQNPK